jgi:hypothetical protein
MFTVKTTFHAEMFGNRIDADRRCDYLNAEGIAAHVEIGNVVSYSEARLAMLTANSARRPVAFGKRV